MICGNKNKQIINWDQSYTLTNAFAVVGTGTDRQLSMTCIKTAHYRVVSEFTFAAAADTDDCSAYIAKNTDMLGPTLKSGKGCAANGWVPFSLMQDNVYIKKGDVLAIYAEYQVAGGAISAIPTVSLGYFSITEV
jgi:hypothetical protein